MSLSTVARTLSTTVPLSRRVAVTCFVLFAGFWFFAFVNDIGNFWHGGTPLGLVLTEAAAILGLLALLDVLRSDTLLAVKIAFGVIAVPLAIFTGGVLFYAGKQLLSV